MRSIKFKAWDSKNKKWLKSVPYLEYLLDDPNEAVSHHDIDEEMGLYWYPHNCLGPDFNGRIKYVQYIGLSDQNNIEIYEGDIIQFTNRKSNNYEIFYYKGTPVFKVDDGSILPIFFADLNYLKVVGNVFENEDLLK